MTREKLIQLENFLFEKLDDAREKYCSYCYPLDVETLCERAETFGYREALCQVIDELQRLKLI